MSWRTEVAILFPVEAERRWPAVTVIMRRREFIQLLGGAASVAVLGACAGASGSIGVLTALGEERSEEKDFAAFRRACTGWHEGQVQYRIEYRSAAVINTA